MNLGSSRSRLRAAQRRLGAALGGATLTLLATLALAATPAAATVHPVAEGSLEWGIKESWRDYIGANTEVGGGAAFTGWTEDSGGHPHPRGFRFPVVSGTFDDETRTTELELDGWVHFQGYCSGEPERCLLDTRYSDLSLHIGPEAQTLRGTHTGYPREDPGGDLREDVDVVLAKYDVEAATTDFSGGTARWTEIPTVAGPGLGLYGESTALDPTSFQYAGPGGAPDLAQRFDTPGAPVLDAGGEWLADPDSGAVVLHASENHDVVHTVDLVGPGTSEARLAVAAFDAATLEPVGSSYSWSYPEVVSGEEVALRTAFDPATDSVYFVTYDEGEEGDSASVRRAAWDAEAGAYDVELLGSLGALGDERAVFGLAWNAVEGELAAIANDPEGADEYESDTLHRFTPDGGGWQHHEAPLRLPDTGEWAEASVVTSPFDQADDVWDREPLGVARDGSYVAAGWTGKIDPGNHHYPSLHIEVGASGEATVTPISGTRPGTVLGVYYGFRSVAEAPDGSLLVHNSKQSMDAYARVDVSGGKASRVGDIVRAPVDAVHPYEVALFANSVASDQGRGIVWATDWADPSGYRLHALQEDLIVGSYAFTGAPQQWPNYNRVEVGPDGDIYLPTEESANHRPGYRRLGFEGFAPEVSGQPEDRSVVLGVGEEAEEVRFAVATGDEEDSIQWQKSAPGQAAFEDIDGATRPTLAVRAAPALDGTVYRAKVSNAAGEIVSDEVTLSVQHAPAIASAPSSQTVTEGTEAVFLLAAGGNPEPQVVWERRVGGFWQRIDPEDVNFVVNGPSLTVRFTNTEQSGARFRARVANAAGTVYTDPATLTVEPRAAIPPEGLELENVTLEWTGNEEMQRKPPFGDSSYLSAGASAGDEATYAATAGDVRVFQVGAGDGERLATWDTRAAHVGGGGEQLVRLYGGAARIEPDGSAVVEWDGSFSVNFYDGLVPFTFLDPELEVDAAGSGTLSAEMVGCESSQSEPGLCEPFAARPDVVVARFSGVEVDPAGEVEIDPAYEGVEVEVPEGETPQNRGAAGWGAWPQPFVDFHAETGLLSYWYSSGSAFDPYKPPLPFVVDFSGATPPDSGGDGEGGEDDGGEGGPLHVPENAEEAVRTARWPVMRRVAVRRALVRGNGLVAVLRVGCRGPVGCAVRSRATAPVAIGKRRFRARVLAPRAVRPGTWATVRLRLGRGARAALGGGRARARVWIGVRSGERRLMRPVTAVLRGPRARPRDGAGRAVRRVVVRRTVTAAGAVPVAALRCRGGRPCAVRAPRIVSTRAGGGRLAARVQTPRRVAPGRLARVRLRLGAGAVRRLADGAAVLRVPVALRSGKRVARRLLVVRLAGRAKVDDPGDGGDREGGAPGGGSPESEPISGAPPELERPDGAVDVEGVEISWYPRDSWVRYASSGTGAGDGIRFSDGATGIESEASACPDRPSSSGALLPYEVEFAARDSWYDPDSGRAGIYGEGEVSFRWKAHTIDLSLADPEVEIDGGDSRAIFRVRGAEGTPYPDERADLVNLDLGDAPSVDGDSYSYDLMRGTLSENGVNVFAGFYSPPDNDEFGCVSVSFELP